jgi:hypothetical protein
MSMVHPKRTQQARGWAMHQGMVSVKHQGSCPAKRTAQETRLASETAEISRVARTSQCQGTAHAATVAEATQQA